MSDSFPEIPGYRIVRAIGSGGMATVYLAVQESLHREVALKVMTPGLSVDEVYCHRFLKEGRIAAQLAHQNLLTVYDIGVHEDDYYMASEFLSGGTVYDRLSDGVSVDEAIRIVSDIAQALEYAHSKGFIHRDVKPGNLLFRSNGDCVLGDFGIAKSVDSTTNATKLGTSVGTPQYMSPEQAKGEKADHRTDLYSLGIVFYQLLAGKLPFDGPDPFQVALAQINTPAPKLPGKRSKFQPLLDRLLAKDREDRYSGAGAFLKELQKVSGSIPSTFEQTRREIEAIKSRGGDGGATATGRSSSRQTKGGGLRIARYFALLVFIVAGGATAWMGWQEGWFTANRPDQTVKEVAAPDAAELRRLLQLAEQYTAEDQLFLPPGSNAYESYQEVLRKDPQNDAAREGQKELARLAASTLRQAIDQGDLELAQRRLAEASRRYPIDREIRAIGKEIRELSGHSDATQAASDNNVDDSELAALLARADRFYESKQIVEAARAYQEALASDPANDRANDRLNEIGDSWATGAERSMGFGDYDRARKMIDKGLEAKPDHARLIELRKRLNEESPG